MQKITNIMRAVLLTLSAIHIVLADSDYDINIQVGLQDDLVKKIENTIDQNKDKKIRISLQRPNYDEHKNIRIINNILEGQKIYSIKMSKISL